MGQVLTSKDTSSYFSLLNINCTFLNIIIHNNLECNNQSKEFFSIIAAMLECSMLSENYSKYVIHIAIVQYFYFVEYIILNVI